MGLIDFDSSIVDDSGKATALIVKLHYFNVITKNLLMGMRRRLNLKGWLLVLVECEVFPKSRRRNLYEDR